MKSLFSGPCPVCGGSDFSSAEVLWPALITAWQLSTHEISYINRQQGFHCLRCFNNLRAMGLSAAILREVGYQGTLINFCKSSSELRILEINMAGNLTPVISKLPAHRLVNYPEFDMQDLNIESDSYDLVVHSDTLEHVESPERGLSECRRILRRNGSCIFTIPIIVDRMGRMRSGLEHSYHGQSDVCMSDQLVYTEFGMDAWKTVLRAGFSSCEIFSFEYPAALVLIARK